MEHIKSASKMALKGGPSPRMEAGQLLINKFSKIAATLPDPPPTPRPPEIPALRPHVAYAEGVKNVIDPDFKVHDHGVRVNTSLISWRSFTSMMSWLPRLYAWASFEHLIPTVVIGSVITCLVVMYVRKKNKVSDRPQPYSPIDLPAYSRDDKQA
jgi:hypothetical protein